MTFTLIILATLTITALLVFKTRENIETTLPLAASLMMLILYVLAIMGRMGWITILAALIIVGIGAAIFTMYRHGSMASATGNSSSQGLISAGLSTLILFTLLIIAVTSLTSSQVFTWWDDINFWSSDAKQLFFLKGFPGKYGNVSPEFGDYPPATSIFKWIFLQLSPSVYKESLQFAGYFTMNAVFLLPLVGLGREAIFSVKDKNCDEDSKHTSANKSTADNNCITKLFSNTPMKTILFIVFFTAIMLLPGVFSGIIYYGTPADVTMAILFGNLLYAIWDKKDKSSLFYYGRIAFYTATMLLTKSAAIEWAIFALAFYFVMGDGSKKIIGAIALPAGAYGSWLVFCFLNRRVAKLTGAGLKMAKSGVTMPQNAMDKFKYFVQGFFTMPIHADHNITLDISTGAAVIALFILLYIIYRRKLVSAREYVKLLVYALVTFLLTYGIIFLAHVTIFQTEDQYLDAFAMANSLGRYGCPFTLGMTFLLIGIALRSDGAAETKESRSHSLAVVVIAVLILFTANYTGVHKYLFSYRDAVAENQAYVADMVGDEGRTIVSALQSKELWGQRVLVVRDGHTYTWVHDAYTSKEACPVALVYGTYKAEEDTSETIANMIKSSHASYVYVLDYDGASCELFQPLMAGEQYQSGCVYAVNYVGNGVELVTK